MLLHSGLIRFIPLFSLHPDETYRPLVDAAAELVSAFDSAISSMHPVQNEVEVDRSVAALAEDARALLSRVRTRLVRSPGPQIDKEACRSFLDRVETRLAVEEKAWAARKMRMDKLVQVLEC